MSTQTEKALIRVREYFRQNPKSLARSVKEAGIRRSTADSALDPKTNPTFETIAKLDKTIPCEFQVEPAEG